MVRVMSLSGPFCCDFPPIFVELGNSLGVYVVEQNVEPVILLNSQLEDTDLSLAQIVHDRLYGFHSSLEEVYKLFPLRVYYEDLIPLEAVPMPEPEVIFVGRAMRLWRFSMENERVRVVGDIISKAG
jgi:hypothetical protein